LRSAIANWISCAVRDNKALLDQDVTVKVDVQHNEPVTISSAASKSSATATAKTGVAAGSGS
jgi:hypothetical protein